MVFFRSFSHQVKRCVQLLGLICLPVFLSSCEGEVADDGTTSTTLVNVNGVTVVQNVLVTPDTTDPVITVLQANPVRINLGDVYTDAGATATDATDGTLTGSIVTTGTVDGNTLGTYTITYTVSDAASNETIVTRTVYVKDATPINDTGLLWGGNYPTGNNGTCIGDTIGEQDCSSGRDATGPVKVGDGMGGFDFTKLDTNGVALANQALTYGAQPWNCVKDNHTGLIWEVKTLDAQLAGLHSKDDLFDWYDTDTTTNGGADGSSNNNGETCTGYILGDTSTHCNSEAYIARVNASNAGAGLCAGNDWRLPTMTELQTIAHLGKITPAIDEDYFPNSNGDAGNAFYWSSTSAASNVFSAKGIYFGNGYSTTKLRQNSHSIRLVRNAP